MKLSIVIPYSGRRPQLDKLLKSIVIQQTQHLFEVILVANPPGILKNLVLDPLKLDIKIFESEKGVNEARNLGLQKACGQIVYFLDDDCELIHPNHLEDLINTFESRPNIDGLGGFYELPSDGNSFDRIYNQLQNDWLRRHSSGDRCYHLLGGNSAYKRTVLKEYQFDRRIIFGSSELEFQLRLFKNNFFLSLSDKLNVRHNQRIGLIDLINKAFKQGQGAAYAYSVGTKTPEFIYFSQNQMNDGAFILFLYQCAHKAGFNFYARKQLLETSNIQVLILVGLELLRSIAMTSTSKLFSLINIWQFITHKLRRAAKASKKSKK